MGKQGDSVGVLKICNKQQESKVRTKVELS